MTTAPGGVLAALALLVWVAAGPASAVTRCVDDDGSNTVDCELATTCGVGCCRSLDYLKTAARTSGSTFTWAPGDVVTLCPVAAGYCHGDGSTNVETGGVQIGGVCNSSGAWCRTDGDCPGSTCAHMTGVVVEGVDAQVVTAAGTFAATASAQTLVRCGRPPPSNQNSGAVTITDDDVTFRHADVRNTRASQGGSGIKVEFARRVTIEDVYVHDNAYNGIEFGGVGAGGVNGTLWGVVRHSLLATNCTGGSGCAGLTLNRAPLLYVHDVTVDNRATPLTGEMDAVHVGNAHGWVGRRLAVTGGSEDGADKSRTGTASDKNKCYGGSNDGTPCDADGTCPGGLCRPSCASFTHGGCVGGTEEGAPCSGDSQCAGGGRCRRWLIDRSIIRGNSRSSTAWGNEFSGLALKGCTAWGRVTASFIQDDPAGDTLQCGGLAIRLENCARDIDFLGVTFCGQLRITNVHYNLAIKNTIGWLDETAPNGTNKSTIRISGTSANSTNAERGNVFVNSGSGQAIGLVAGSGTGSYPPVTTLCGDVPCCDPPGPGPGSGSYNDTPAGLASWQAAAIWGGGSGTGDAWGTLPAFVGPIAPFLPDGWRLATSDIVAAPRGEDVVIAGACDTASGTCVEGRNAESCVVDGDCTWSHDFWGTARSTPQSAGAHEQDVFTGATSTSTSVTTTSVTTSSVTSSTASGGTTSTSSSTSSSTSTSVTTTSTLPPQPWHGGARWGGGRP